MSWKLSNKDKFPVKPIYNALTSAELGPFKFIWKAKIPAKIKILLWLVANNAILTKDNMIKRQWKGDPSCYFCNCPESMQHLLFTCPVAKIIWATVATCIGASNIPIFFEQSWNWCERWISNGKQFHAVGTAAICWAIWKMRNRVCFDGVKLHNPLAIVSHACALMKFWAGLQKEVDREVLIKGVDDMLEIAVKLLNEKRQGTSQVYRLRDGAEDDDTKQESRH